MAKGSGLERDPAKWHRADKQLFSEEWVREIVRDEMRKQARQAGRVLPGRGGKARG